MARNIRFTNNNPYSESAMMERVVDSSAKRLTRSSMPPNEVASEDTKLFNAVSARVCTTRNLKRYKRERFERFGS